MRKLIRELLQLQKEKGDPGVILLGLRDQTTVWLQGDALVIETGNRTNRFSPEELDDLGPDSHIRGWVEYRLRCLIGG